MLSHRLGNYIVTPWFGSIKRHKRKPCIFHYTHGFCLFISSIRPIPRHAEWRENPAPELHVRSAPIEAVVPWPAAPLITVWHIMHPFSAHTFAPLILCTNVSSGDNDSYSKAISSCVSGSVLTYASYASPDQPGQASVTGIWPGFNPGRSFGFSG